MAKKKKLAVEQADLAVDKKMQPLENNKAVKGAGKISEAADQPPLIIGSSLVLSAGLIGGNRRLARAGARMLATELLATAIKSVIEHTLDRTRPFAVAKRGYKSGKGAHDESELNSFPSGHTAGAVGVARALVRDYPDGAFPAAASAIAVAAIQVPRRAHWVSDVVAGAVVGLAAEAIVNAVIEEFRKPVAPRPLRRRRQARDASASAHLLPRTRSSRSSRPTP